MKKPKKYIPAPPLPKAIASGIPVFCAHADIVDVAGLKPNVRNPNTHPPAQVALLAKIIEAQGWRNPIVVSNRSGLVVKGHCRLEAAKLIGVATVPVDRQDYATAEAELADLLADNRLSELAETDHGILTDVLIELDTGAFDMDLTGYDDEALKFVFAAEHQGDADAEPQIDRAEELNKVWGVKPGDLWRIGDHFLLCGDSTKREDVERVMGGEKATLIFTDPPYGVSIGKKNAMLNTFLPSGRCSASLQMDDMTPEQLGSMLLKAFTICRQVVMADDCSVFVCSPQGGGLGMMMMMMMKDAGLEVRHVLNWVKNCATFSMGRLDYDYQHEPILFTWGKTHKRIMAGPFKTSLWAVDKPHSSGMHATTKPVELPSCAIQNHTEDGDIVFDGFIGSGTTMIAAQNLGRKCRGIEISPPYVAVCLERMKDAFPGIKIQRMVA